MNTSEKNPKTALIKKALMALTVVLAIGFSAFTNAPKKQAADWYLPTSTISASSPARLNFSNYDSGNPLDSSPSCSGATNVCAAEFANGTDQPATTVNFKASN